MKRSIVLLAVLIFSSGCATVSMLPKSSAEIQFGKVSEGKTGWSSYREEARFRGTPANLIVEAAKAGLADAGFALRRVDAPRGAVIGEHGMTLHDWNVLAGVYFKPDGEDVIVAVLVEGSKDIGYSGDVTSGAWTGQILKGMREYILRFGSGPAAGGR